MSLSHQAFVTVRDAVESGRIVHAPHPDFGGVVTIGFSARAGSEPVFETIHHGGTIDTGDVHRSLAEAVRNFVYQVGKHNALAGAQEALAK